MHVRSGLFAVALGAGFVDPSHEHPLCELNVVSVRIVTIVAVHPALDDRMMILKAELGVLVEVALEAGFGILAGIENELAGVAAFLDVAAARSVTRFTTLAFDTFALAGNGDTSVGSKLKVLDLFLVAGAAGLHAHVFRAGDHRRGYNDPFNGRTRDDYDRNDSQGEDH